MPSYRITKLFLFFFLWVNVMLSQNFPGNNYTSANKLPNNAVRSLLVDSNNILWIGTDNGVVKKENDVFTNFFEEDGLALNSCWAIAEDRNKNIWFGSYGAGVSIYDGKKFRVISEKEDLVHNEITRLFPYQNYMFIGSSDGVSRIDINTFKVYSWKVPSDEELIRVTGFFTYKQEVYVSTYNTGIYKISGDKMVKVKDHEYIYSVFQDKDSIFSSNKGFYTRNSLAEYVLEEDFISSEKLGYSIIWDHVKTRKNKVFAAAWGIYDTNGGIYELKNDGMRSRASDFNIPSNKIISLAYDEQFEKLYVGSLDSGLYEVNLNSQIKLHTIQDKDVLGFALFGNNSAVLLNDGIFLKNVQREHSITLAQLKKWQEDYVANSQLPLPRHEDSFYELDYTTPAEDIIFYDIKISGNTFWINTNIGIFVVNNSAQLERYLPLHSEEINFTQDGDLIETHPYGGVRVYDDPDAFEYTHFKQDDPGTPTMVVNSLRKNGKTYFLSVFSGLYVWENAAFKSFLENGIWEEKKLRHICSLGNDLAISNEFGDIFIVNDKESFKIIKKIPRAKIQGNTISFLKEFNGSLLIGTEKGMTIYTGERYIFLNEEQGLQQPLLSAEVYGDLLYVGTRDGFYNIDLSRVCQKGPLVNELNIKEVYVNNQKKTLDLSEDPEKIKLEHDENTVLLKFGTNAHPYPKKLQYQYRLNPKDKWSLASNKPEIFLPFLPSKNYEIAVRVLDSSTGLDYTQSLTKLAILPPFWKTWWFALLVLMSILLFVFSIYTYQITQNRKFEEQKRLIQKRFEETRMEALMAQMNPHFIFNAMNSIQHYIMDSDIDNASLFLGDFAKLIRLNLDHCTQPKILLIEEIEYLQSYIRVENTRFNNAVNVIVDTDPAIDLYDVEIPTMLLQTFVENVFVHAFPAGVENPTLKVSFKLISNHLLQCWIEDNGVGFSSNSGNSLHESKGVNLVKERLALLGYDVEEAIQMISEKNKGTTIILKLQV